MWFQYWYKFQGCRLKSKFSSVFWWMDWDDRGLMHFQAFKTLLLGFNNTEPRLVFQKISLNIFDLKTICMQPPNLQTTIYSLQSTVYSLHGSRRKLRIGVHWHPFWPPINNGHSPNINDLPEISKTNKNESYEISNHRFLVFRNQSETPLYMNLKVFNLQISMKMK